VRYHFTCENST